MPPSSPTPSPTLVTASAYILPDAVSQGDWAFGDEPIVIYKSERLRWVNAVTAVSTWRRVGMLLYKVQSREIAFKLNQLVQ